MKEVKQEMMQFINDIQVWGKNWVKEVKQCVLEHLEELAADEAVRHIARKYAEMVEAHERHNENWLLRSYEYELDEILEHTNSDIHSYSMVLYELCYRRYKKGLA